MEGLIWLLLKLGVLLAFTAAAFFALGWWSRGKTVTTESTETENETERLHSALRAAQSEVMMSRERHQIDAARIKEQEARITALQAASLEKQRTAEPSTLILETGQSAAKIKPRAKRKVKT